MHNRGQVKQKAKQNVYYQVLPCALFKKNGQRRQQNRNDNQDKLVFHVYSPSVLAFKD
jgi:hypothetical protein